MELEFGVNSRFGRFPYKKASNIINYALENGIKRFDTGYSYGNGKSQPLLARCLASQIEKAREDISISTKCSAPNTEYIEYCIRKSIEIFKCGYIDNFHIWGPSMENLDKGEILHKLKCLKREGLVRLISVNTHQLPLIKKISNGSYQEIQGVLIDFNLLRQDRKKYIKNCKKNKIKVFAGTALGQGTLINSIPRIYLRTLSPFYLGRAIFSKDTKRYLKPSKKFRKYIKVNYKYLKDKIPLSFVRHETSIDYVPIGMMSISSIDKNIEVFKNPIDLKVVRKISKWAVENCQIDNF